MPEIKQDAICAGLVLAAMLLVPTVLFLFTGCASTPYQCSTEPVAVEHEAAGGKPLRGIYLCYEQSPKKGELLKKGKIEWQGGPVPGAR